MRTVGNFIMAKRTNWNIKSNAIIKQRFLDSGITFCEICGNTFGLTYMHRRKRRYYTSLESLSDMGEVVLACLSCHIKYEFDSKATAELFDRLRGKLVC